MASHPGDSQRYLVDRMSGPSEHGRDDSPMFMLRTKGQECWLPFFCDFGFRVEGPSRLLDVSAIWAAGEANPKPRQSR